MANYATLKAAIESTIRTNGQEEITGQILQNAIIALIESLGAEFQFAGVASTSTNPGTPDHNVMYIAGAGTYPNFGGTEVEKGHIGVFAYNGSWNNVVVETGAYFEFQEYPSGDAIEFTFYDSENTDGKTIKINKTVSGISNAPDEAISQWWAAQIQRKIQDVQGFTDNFTSLSTTEQSLGLFGIIKTGKVIDSITGVNKLIFIDDESNEYTVNTTDLPYVAPADFVSVKLQSGTASNVSINVRGDNDVLISHININEIANHPTAYTSAALALNDVPTLYRRKGMKVVYYDDTLSLWVEMLNVDDAGANWWTDVTNNWVIEGPIETELPTNTGGQQLRVGGTKRGNLDDVLNVNVWNNQATEYSSKDNARAAVPTNKRKLGAIITYLVSTGTDTSGWMIDEFTGSSISDWAEADNWETIGPVSVSQNTLTIGGEEQREVGVYEENPVWADVWLDKNEKILFGVKLDGNFYFGAGCPPQVKLYISDYGYSKAAIDAILNNKVDKVTGKSLIDSTVASKVSDNNGASKITGIVETDGEELSANENAEFVKVLCDAFGRLIKGIRKTGNIVYKTIQEFDRDAIFNKTAKFKNKVEMTDDIIKYILSNNINDGSIKALFPKYDWEGYIANLATSKNLGPINDRTYKPLVLQHFSDIHNDYRNFARVLEFNKMYKEYIADILLSGDVAGNDWQGYSADMTGLDGFYDVLKIIGNHDVYNYNNQSGENANEAQCFARYMQGIENWGVQYTDDVCYWYKDYIIDSTGTKDNFGGSAFDSTATYTQGSLVTYDGKFYKSKSSQDAGTFNPANWVEITSFGIRLIGYDFMHNSSAQTAWLQATLNDAITKGLSVIITTHGVPFMEDNTVEWFDTPFNGDEWWRRPESSSHTPLNVIEMVSDFIDNGGEFICYLGGHIHTDKCGCYKTGTITTTGGQTYTNNHKQVFIVIGLAMGYGTEYDFEGSGQSEIDICKVTGTKTLDLFNLESFDIETKTISVLRIGCDIDRLLRSRRSMVIDYKNSELLYTR